MGGGGELPLYTVRKNLGGGGVEFHRNLTAHHPTEFRTVVTEHSSSVNPSIKREKYLKKSPCVASSRCLACKALDLRNFSWNIKEVCALFQQISRYYDGSKSVSRGPKVSPMMKRLDFITKRLILNAFFEKYNLRIFSSCINVVVILLCVVICAAWIERRSSEKFRVMRWRNS